MNLFTYLLKKRGHNSSVNGDLFSYLLASRKRGTYQTYTGTQINVSDSINARMKNWILGGNSNQNGTPTPDAPIDIHNVIGENNVIENSGKNLYDPIINTNPSVLNGITPELEINGTVKVSGTPTQSWSNICQVSNIYLESGTYTFSISETYNFRVGIRYFTNKEQTTFEEKVISSGNTSITFTTSSKIYGWRVFLTNLTIGTEINETLKLQVETGSTATPFEKYKGRNYKVSLASKNLMFYNLAQFTTNENTWHFLNGQKGAYGSNIGSKTNIKTPVENGKTYTFSCNVNMEMAVLQIVYSDETVITIDTGEIGKHTITFTAIKNDEIIIRVRPIDTQNVDISNIQIEEGNKATPYVPYMTPIELCKIGTYQDKIYKSNDKWLLEKNTKKMFLTSTLGEWSAFNKSFVLNNNDIPQTEDALCSSFENIGNSWWGSDNEICRGKFSIANALHQFKCMPLENMPLEDFINWLDTTQPTLYFGIPTPNITEITDDNLINQLEELSKARSFEEKTNISQLSEQLPFDLTVDIKTL